MESIQTFYRQLSFSQPKNPYWRCLILLTKSSLASLRSIKGSEDWQLWSHE